MHRTLLFAGMVLALWLPPDAGATGGLYRWTGADGRVHFADRPGVAGAQLVDGYEATLSIIDTAESRRQADLGPNPLVERELRWQQTGREEQRRAAEREIEAKTQRCARLREQLDAAEGARRRERVRQLETRWYRECR